MGVIMTATPMDNLKDKMEGSTAQPRLPHKPHELRRNSAHRSYCSKRAKGSGNMWS